MRLFGLLVKETPPVSLHEGWRGFCIVVIFFQTEKCSRLVIFKILAISSISVLASLFLLFNIPISFERLFLSDNKF